MRSSARRARASAKEPAGILGRALLGSASLHGAAFAALAAGVLFGAETLVDRRGQARISVAPASVPRVSEPELELEPTPPARPDAAERLVAAPEEVPELEAWEEPPLEPVWASDQPVPARRAGAAETREPAEQQPVAAAEPPSAIGPQPVSEGVLAPAVLLSGPPPVYPRLSVRQGEEGVVLCELFVDAAGHVVRVALLESCGHARLDAAAVEALREWRFRPAARNGRAVPDRVRHRVVFRLGEER